MYLRIIIIYLSIFATILPAHAQGVIFTDGDFTFRTLENQKCEIIEWQNPNDELILPSTAIYNDTVFTVTRIESGSSASKHFSGDLIIPDAVTYIGWGAFRGCSFDGKLVLPKSLTHIEPRAFEDCEFTGELILPDSLDFIGYSAFSGNKFSGNLIIPNSVKSIGSSVFIKSKFEKLYLGNSLYSIGEYAFRDCKNISGQIIIPSTVTHIYNSAFIDCVNITEIIFEPNSKIETIGENAFMNCTNLINFKMFGSVNPFNLKGTFNNCPNLTSIRLGGTLCSIDKGSIDKSFTGCDNIKSIIFETGNTPLEIYDANIFNNCPIDSLYLGRNISGSSMTFVNKSTITDLTLGGGITNVPDGYFAGCSGIKSITIEYNNIFGGQLILGSNGYGKGMFSDCEIDSLFFGRTLSSKSFPDQFQNMTSITRFKIGDGVTDISESAFSGCSGISSLTIPSSVLTIGKNAFAGCTGIKSLRFEDGYIYDSKIIYKYKPKPVSIGNMDGNRGAFSDSPIDSIYLGRNLEYDIPPFKGNTTLKSVSVGMYVGRINDECFAGCTGLYSISFKGWYDTLYGLLNNFDRKIGRRAFAECNGLTSALTLPHTVTAVEDSAFINCSGITKINIEGNKDAKILPFGKGAFAGTPANTVSVSRNTTGSPFAGNASLNDLTIGEMVTALEPDAFAGCTAISKVTSESANPPALQVSGFDTQTYDSAFLFVPDYTVTRYEAAQGWKNFTIFGKYEVLPETVTISADKAELFAGSQMSLTAEVLPANTRKKTITWKSSDESVATVDQSGNISAIKPGTATITASTVNRITASCSVTVLLVPVEATAIAFPEDNVEVTQGESLQLTVLFTPEETTERELTWSCDNCDIATVDENGTVTALIPGTATVTATTSNGLTASCTVTVLRRIIYAESISLDSYEAKLTEGESVQLTATVSPDNTDDKTLLWSSSDEAVATVDATGLVSAIREGKATVTATTSNELTAACTVTVIPPVIEADGITLNITQTQIYTDGTLQLTATVSPDDTTDKTVMWSSSNGEIATVDANGLVSPISEGKTTITATTSNGLTASCEVTVLKRIVIISPESISLDRYEAELTEGESVQLTATVSPEDADDKTVTWTSDNSAVATVDADGLVTAISEGMATITATTANGLTASCEVTVLKRIVIISPESILLNITQAELTEGESVQLTATVSPENTTDKTVTWTSDNSAVATVDASGLVTAIREGEAIITASTVNALAASCHIIVNGHEWREGNGSYIRVENGDIVVYGQGTAEVFNRQGRLVAKSKAGRITGLPRDIYFVRFANRSYKIRL